jgi:hypothetical protein
LSELAICDGLTCLGYVAEVDDGWKAETEQAVLGIFPTRDEAVSAVIQAARADR